MRNYFITGLSGYLGHALLDILNKEKDVRIFALVLPQDKYRDELIKRKVEVNEGDLLSKEDVSYFLSHKVEGEKIVIHIAGRISTVKKGDPLTTKINVEGTKNVLDRSIESHIDKFIYISSVDALDRRKDKELIYEQDEYHVDKVDGVYSKSKAEANNYILSKKDDIHTVIIMPSALIGPNDTFHSPINDAIRLYLKGKMPSIVSGGYNLVDVRDVARGIYEASNKAKRNESYILGGTYLSVKELFTICSEISSKKPIKLVIPHFIIKLISPFIELSAKIKKKKPLFTGFSMDCLKQNSRYSSQKAIDELGYKIRDIKESIKDTITYIQNEKAPS